MPRKNKTIIDIRSEARKYTATAFRVVHGLMISPKVPAATRLAAAIELWNRGHGKPEASIKLDVRDERSTQQVLDYIDKIFNVLPTSAGAIEGPVIEAELDEPST